MRFSFFAVFLAGLALAIAALFLKAVRGEAPGYVELAKGEGVKIGGDVLALKDFRVLRYASGKIRQYESDVHVVDRAKREAVHAVVSVNHPFVWKGFWIYQNSYDAETERSTVLMVRRDPYLPLAAAGGLAMLAAAFLGIFAFFRSPEGDRAAASRARRTANAIAAFAVFALPLFIVGRAVLRPDPPPALQSPLMAPHVAAYMLGYLIMIFATFGIGRRFMGLGFFFMVCGFVLGAAWGKICWGDFWQYDPKEMWSLFTIVSYFAYFAFRRVRTLEPAMRYLSLALIVFTLTWVNFSRFFAGIHSYAR